MRAPGKLYLLLIILVQLAYAAASRARTQSSDEAALADLISRYFAAYARPDLEALVKLWSFRSPDVVSSIEEAQRTQGELRYTVANVTLSLVRIADGKAVLRASAEFTPAGAVKNERRVRNFALIREEAGWKVWRDAPASEDLSAFLEKGSEWRVSADSIEQFAVELINSSNADRERLLADNQKMLTRELADALIGKVGPLQAPGSYERAIGVLQLVKKIARQISEPERVAKADRAMGDVFREWGNSAQALSSYQEAVAGFDSIGRASLKASTLISIGQVYFARKNYKLAIDSYEKALAEFERLRDKRAIADTLEEFASVYYDQEIYDRALELFVKCLKLRETFATRDEIAATHNSVGNVYFQRSEYDSAIQEYEKALGAFESLNEERLNAMKTAWIDADAIVSTLSNIAAALYSEGYYEAALGKYLRAVKLQDGLRDKYVGANLRLAIANVYSAQGNYGLALEHLRTALSIFESLRDKNKIAGALREIGAIYSQLQNYQASLDQYQKSLKLYEELVSLSDSSMRLYEIGNVRFAMGDFDLAIESYEKARWQFEQIKHATGVASMFASIAGVRYAQKKYDLAIEFYQKSLAAYEALGDRSRVAGLIERIAAVRYSQGEYAASLELSARAIEMAEALATPDTLWRGRLTQGLAYRATADDDRAKQSFEESIATIETMRKRLVRGEPDAQHFFQVRNNPYVAMLELLVAQNKVPEALAYAERIRANSLIDNLQRALIAKSMTASEFEQERKLQTAVIAVKTQMNRERERARPDLQRHATLQLRLQRALEDYLAFENALYSAHPALKGLRGEGDPIPVNSAPSLLRDSTTALLEFVVADTKTYLFVLTRNTRKVGREQVAPFVLNAYVINAGREEVAGRVRKFRQALAEPNEKFHQSARETYDLLFNSAREQINDKSTWVILPDDALWHLPFAALKPADNRYLLEDHALAYAGSLTTFGEMTKPRPAKPGRASQLSLLAIVNPAISPRSAEQSKMMGGPEIVALSPDSENEAKPLASLYGLAGNVLVGGEASEAAVKREAGKFDVVQFAAPAILSDASPMFSRVLLADSENEDGMLETWEISRLDLKADVVLFPASDAVATRAGGGEAISSLAWMLLVAGCRAEVLTLWSNNSSNSLIVEFHRRLAASGPPTPVSKAKALQRAALKLLKDSRYQHPINWAGAVLIGNPK